MSEPVESRIIIGETLALEKSEDGEQVLNFKRERS